MGYIVDEEYKLKTAKFILKNRRCLWDDYEYCKMAVQHHGLLLRHVNLQTEKICKLAVQLNSLSARHIKNTKQRDFIKTLEIHKDNSTNWNSNGIQTFWRAFEYLQEREFDGIIVGIQCLFRRTFEYIQKKEMGQ